MIFHGDNATLPFTFYQKYIHNITYADDDLLVSIRARSSSVLKRVIDNEYGDKISTAPADGINAISQRRW